MLPPSSPQLSQAQHLSHPSLSRGPPQATSFTVSREPPNRDLPNTSSANRPESSMSISSMLGSDSIKPSRESGSAVDSAGHSPMRVAARPSSRVQIGLAPSPPQSRDHPGFLYQRSRSPERVMFASSQPTRSSRAFSGGAPRQQNPSAPIGSSDLSRLSSSSNPFNPQYSPKSDSGPQQDWKGLHEGRPSLKRPFERPNSQPVDSITRSLEFDKNPHLRPTTSQAEGFRPTSIKHFQSSKVTDGVIESRPQGPEDSTMNGYLDLRSRQVLGRQTLPPASQGSPAPSLVGSPTYPVLSKPIPPSPEPVRTGRETDLLANRVLEREQSAPTQSPYNSESIRRLREERLIAASLPPQIPTLMPSNMPSHLLQQLKETPRQDMSQGSSVAPGPETPRGRGGLEQPVKADEDNLQNHRSSLALLIDNSKRGRISPLPQAVQGAQARVSGPASDPGIKNEFARMFIGIGSGVGRAGRLGSRTSTPFSPSPTTHLETGRKTPLVGRGEPVELTLSRVAAKGSRKGRKAKDEEPMLDPETKQTESNVEIPSARGVKRTRHGHHHHPHQHAHQ